MDMRDKDTVETRTPARRGLGAATRWLVALVVVALLAAAAVFGLSPALRARLLRPAAPKVPLKLNSTPPGADAFVDDVRVGVTPTEAAVAPGPHRVRLVLRGHLPWHEEVDPSATPEVAPTLKRVKLATLVVESDPDRAEVFLDEERRGATPVEIRDVEAGPHTLRILKEPLYQPIIQRIELKEGEARRISVRLESGLESLYVERIKKEPGKLSNYTELLHVHVLNGEAEKAVATVAQAVGAMGSAEVTPTDLGQFFDELRRIVRGQAGALDATGKAKLQATLLALLEKLLQKAPSEYTTYGPLVTMLSQAGQFEEVYKLCEKTASQPSGRGLVHYYVATVCLGQGETANAVRLLERAVELQPSLYSARLSLASAYHRADKLDEALHQYAEAEKAIPASVPYYQGSVQVGIARVLVSKKDIAGAIARYKKAIAVAAPPSYNCQWRLQFAELLLEQGRKQEATEQYQEIVKLTSVESEVGLAARRALRRLGEK